MGDTDLSFIEDYSTTGYHGTDRDCAGEILGNNFLPSRGEDHWLGSGVYFFESGIGDGLEDAKKWGVVNAWDNENGRNKYKVYCVIEAAIKFKKLWDLSSQDGLKLFEYTRKQLFRRVVKKGNPSSGRQFDNAIIEISANLTKFDGLKAWFFIKLDAKSRKMRVLPGLPNVTVLCVRNPHGSISLDQLSLKAEGFVSR